LVYWKPSIEGCDATLLLDRRPTLPDVGETEPAERDQGGFRPDAEVLHGDHP